MERLLAIFAHPDDEGVCAGTLARYARQGVAAQLICATRGEVGEISDPALATPETLGAVRTGELEAACAAIGIAPPHFLDYRDSGMAGTPENDDPRSLAQADPQEATGRIVALLRRWRPDAVITFEPFGWYGHPDHIAVHRLATAAFGLAGDAAAYPDAGEPWQPQALFYAVLPISRFQRMFEQARAAGFIEGDPPFGDRFPIEQQRATEAQVTHVLDVRNYFAIRQAVTQAHRTQFSADGPFSKIPPEVMSEVFGEECFIQIEPPPTSALRDEHATALIAG
jgi:mycothiol S-conjugate amidase